MNLENFYDEILQQIIFETEKVTLEINILNLFNLPSEEIKLFKDKCVNRYYKILTKGVTSIILFNKSEYYEYSQDIYTKLKDLYELIMTSYDDNNNVEDSVSSFEDVFNKSMQLISNKDEFKKYK